MPGFTLQLNDSSATLMGIAEVVAEVVAKVIDSPTTKNLH
jgi:hypothetical protein